MPFWFFAALSLTILLPAAIALVRFRQIEPVYSPFLILIWVGAANETAALLLIREQGSNLVLYNLYALAEWWLLLWQFRRWGLFSPSERWYPVLLLAGGLLWAGEGLVLDTLQRPNSYFLILGSFGVVIMSVLTIARSVFFESYRLWQNAKFLICLGIVLFFTFSILIEVFLLFGIGGSTAFRNRIYAIFYYSNALSNFLYAYSILCMPTRLQFIGPLPS